jgi:hypothetical protein
MRIRVQCYGAYEDPNAESLPEVYDCRAITRLADGGYRLNLNNGRTYSFGGDCDVEELLPDGTFHRVQLTPGESLPRVAKPGV